MAVIKLKQSDLEKMVQKTIMNEEVWQEDSELPLDEEPVSGPAKTLTMMAGEDGNYYVVDWSNPNDPKIVAQTHK